MDIFDFLASPLASGPEVDKPEVAEPEVEAPGGGMISCSFLLPSLAAFFNAFFKKWGNLRRYFQFVQSSHISL